MNLGVIIVTHNRLKLLKECIEACLEQSYEFKKILVINNASTDGTEEYLSGLNYENIEVINSKENLGGAGGFYKGIEEAQKYDLDYLLLIDDDAILDSTYNKEILKHMENNEEKIYAYSGTVKTNGIIQCEHRRHLKKGFKCKDSNLQEYEQEYFDYDLSTFCGLYISMEVIKKVGLPCKEYFIWFDDTEYSLRIREYSKIRNINSTWLNHKTKISNSSGYNWKSYYGLRNQILIIKKYFSRVVLAKFIFNMIIMKFAASIMSIIKRDNYYNLVSDIYKDALKDGLQENMGKNDKYMPNLIIKKRNKED